MSDFETRARHAADAVQRQIAELPTYEDDGIRRAQRPPSRGPLRLAVAASILIGAVAIGVPVLRAGLVTGGDSAASGGGVTPGGAGAASGGEGAAFAVTGALTPFPTCDTVLQYFKDQAPDDLIARVDGGMVATTEDRSSASAGAESAAGPPEHSATNVQEAGVDEPDIVKTDGRRIVAVAQGRVHLISSVRGELTRQKTLPGSAARNVFLSGNRLLVFSDQAAQGGQPGSPWFGAQAALTMYDISSLSDPLLIAT